MQAAAATQFPTCRPNRDRPLHRCGPQMSPATCLCVFCVFCLICGSSSCSFVLFVDEHHFPEIVFAWRIMVSSWLGRGSAGVS